MKRNEGPAGLTVGEISVRGVLESRGSLIAITTSGVPMTDLGSNAYWVSKAGVERIIMDRVPGITEVVADE